LGDRTPFGTAARELAPPQRNGHVCVITVPANDLVAQIHDRMPLILPEPAYERWLGAEPNPHDLLTPFAAELMVMWPSPGLRRPDA
jgi:putative SOS response-associated peptidase YedK